MREAIWKSMLDADMNARYWKSLVNRYVLRDRVLKIFLAIMASGTVASWGLWEGVPWLWKILSSISALVAISLPILNYQKSIEQMASLAGKWGELRIEYEDLWLQVKDAETPQSLEHAFKNFRKIEVGLQEKETKFSEDRELLERCFNEVKLARAIK